ncbi:MAG: ankyrin repeat domain-containing protein [Simkaniaceae bacterium]|nr:ankyrin repeat domain-containing protein [Candidatus Sacchlamyda saccharinae]
MNPLQSIRDTASAWNPFGAAEEVSPPPSPPTVEVQPGVSQWIPGLSAEEAPPQPSFEKTQELFSNAWIAPHVDAFQGFGKRVCEYITPLVSDQAEEICADETNHTIAASIVTALAAAVVAKTLLTAARSFACRNKDLRQCIEAGSLYGVKKRLLSADVDSTSLKGETALIWASRLGQLAIVKHLLKTADPNIQAGSTGDTALHAAIRAGQNQIISPLLAKADVNKKNAKGQTPIMLAVQEGNEFAIAALAKLSMVDWSAQDVDGNTVMHYMARKKFSQVILDKADANIANNKKELPLHLAAENHDFGGISAGKLARKTTDTYAIDQDGKTPFVRALESHNPVRAKELFIQRKVLTVANSDVVGLALKEGMHPRDIFSGMPIPSGIKPEGLDLPTFAAIYGLYSCTEYLVEKKQFFVGAALSWVSDDHKLVRSLLEKPDFLSKITTRKYNAGSLLRELNTPAPAAASAATAAPSMEMELLRADAKHYLEQLEREHSHLSRTKR